MRKRWFVFLIAFFAAVLRAELIWQSDFKPGAEGLVLAEGAKVLDGGVLDCGYGDPQSKAWASVKIPAADLRAGAISFRYRPAYDLTRKAANAKASEAYMGLFIPAQGSVYTGIRVDWYNTFGPWLHFYLCTGKNDQKNLQAGLNARSNQEIEKFNIQAGVWKNVHVSWTQSTARMWVDGMLAGERTIEDAAPLGLVLGQLYFGAAKVRGMQLPSGNVQFADVRLWNTAETPESVSVERKTVAVGGPGTQMYANQRKRYPASRFAESPVIDGRLDDAVWRQCPELSGFVKNAVGRQYVNAQSVVKLGWDADNLYLCGVFDEPYMANIQALAKSRDGAVYKDDAVEFLLVPNLKDSKDVFQLIANCGEGKYDSRKFDAGWNGNWKSAVHREKDCWTFELSVPFRDLGIVPENGLVMRFLVGRDRVAGKGIDVLSASAEITGGFLSPSEYDFLELREGSLDVKNYEAKLNSAFVEDTRAILEQKIQDCAKELEWGRRLASKSDGLPEAITALEERMSQDGERLRTIMESTTARPREWAKARSSLGAYTRMLDNYAEQINGIGFSAAHKLPTGLQCGITQDMDYFFLKNKGVAVVVDGATGMTAGVFNGDGSKLADWSFDIYNVEDAKRRTHSDERMDKVTSCVIKDEALVIECRNEDLGLSITKRYFLPKVDVTRGRIISKEIAVSGSPAEKTLLTVVSRMHLNDHFTANADYHRIIGAGVLGDKRAVFHAADIKQPISLYYFFNTSTPSLLCAYDSAKRLGLGHYWFKAGGEWVMPGSNPDYTTIVSRNGWDMTWFMTFVTPKPATGEMRIHAFDGDRVNFHSEYRDSPERLQALNVDKVAPEIQYRRYYLNLGFDLKQLDNPDTLLAQKFPFLYERLRSNECSLALSTGSNDLWYGDYPSGDDAILHLEYGPETKKTMTGKQKRALVAAGARRFPKVLPGWYHIPQNISYHSQLVKEHPEFLMKDKDGKPRPAGWSIYMGTGTFTHEFWDEILKRICNQMDYFGERTIYLDYSVLPAQADWGNGVVRHSADHIYFLKKLYREIHRRHGVLFTNATTCDGIQDLTYYEGWDKYSDGGLSWRDAADPIMMRALYAREGVRFIPLYWKGGNKWNEASRNYKEYANLVLSQLVAPVECHHDPYHVHFKDPATGKTNWKNVYAHAVPYFDFSLDVGWTRLANDVDFRPAWWRENTGELEAYAYRKGKQEYIFTALRHVKGDSTQDVRLSADAAKMQFSADKEIFVWQYWPRDPDKNHRNGSPLPPDWDKLFTKIDCARRKADANGRLVVDMPAVAGNLPRLALATQVPATFISLEGKPLTFWQPDVLGNTLVGGAKL
ncbi:MAG: hypothetical protein IJJ33_02115, partial [Victivallales bacterium]|nr:hypothetical protein [Victivallales bacterium]